jgi:hypothetical protein
MPYFKEPKIEMRPLPSLESGWDPRRDSVKELLIRRGIDQSLQKHEELKQEKAE